MAPLTDLSRAFAQHQQLVGSNGEPISRTMQYRKVTKPLLERQRRARINRCLDELKDILVSGLQNEGENVSRLEKADILELTVRHLQKLQSQQTQVELEIEEKFKSGFASCAHEVSRTLAMTPGIDVGLGSSLMIHLGKSLNQINQKSRRIRRSSSSSSCSTESCDSTFMQTHISQQITPPISPNSAYFSSSISPRTTCYSPISLPSCSPTNLSMNSSFSSSIWRPF